MTYQIEELGCDVYMVTSQGRTAGQVSRIDWPTRVRGLVRTDRKWEARLPHQYLLNVTPGTLPCFDTADEAAQFLADHVKVTR